MTDSLTIAERLQREFDRLTPAERRLTTSLLENYPVSGLSSVTTVAQNAGVSTATVVRMAQKLGYRGFPEFQAELRQELAAKISSPIAKRDIWAGEAPTGHVLNRFTEAVIGNIRQTLDQIDIGAFDALCAALADNKRKVYVVGGRITRAMADYFHLHFQVIRRDVVHIQSNSNAWPHHVLDIEAGDVVVVFDVRRYENSTLKLAQMARARGAWIALFTDQWRSPVARDAEFVFSCRIEAPSAWDSNIATLLLIETIIAEVQEKTWRKTRARMEALEQMFDDTGLFRKFT